jgi:transcriptional regulator with XRE-family HTH domain
MVAHRIKEVRKALRLTQTEFGEALGTTLDVIYSLEASRVEPKNVFLKLICTVFKVSPEWLFEGNDEMFSFDPHQELKEKTLSQLEQNETFRNMIQGYLQLDIDFQDLINIQTSKLVSLQARNDHALLETNLNNTDTTPKNRKKRKNQ